MSARSECSQGGAMGDIRQHIQQEMHRLLGPTHHQQQPREVAAPSLHTPRQPVSGSIVLRIFFVGCFAPGFCGKKEAP